MALLLNRLAQTVHECVHVPVKRERFASPLKENCFAARRSLGAGRPVSPLSNAECEHDVCWQYCEQLTGYSALGLRLQTIRYRPPGLSFGLKTGRKADPRPNLNFKSIAAARRKQIGGANLFCLHAR